MMRLQRYVIGAIARPFIVIAGLLIGVFASYSAARYLEQAAAGDLLPSTVLAVIGLRILVHLDVLLPLALFLSVVAGLGHLQRDSELIAIEATGLSPAWMIRQVLYIAVPMALLVAVLSIVLRPLAFAAIYDIEAAAEAEYGLSRISSGHFYTDEQRTVIFAEDADGEEKQRVLMQSDDGLRSRVVYAREAVQRETGPMGRPQLEFRDGYSYLLDRVGGNDAVLRFKTLRLDMQERDETRRRRRKATATEDLDAADEGDLAEFQWRFSTPVSTLLLGLLALPISRGSPRQGRYRAMLLALLAAALYYNLLGVAEAWVDDGLVPALPGLWWVPAGFAVGLGWAIARQFRPGG